MICPNCGQPLPDTAKICFCCKSIIQVENQINSLDAEAENAI